MSNISIISTFHATFCFEINIHLHSLMLLTLLWFLLPSHLPLASLLLLLLNQALAALQGDISPLKSLSITAFFPALERCLHLESSQYNLPLLQPPILFFLVTFRIYKHQISVELSGPGPGDSKVWRILLSHTADTETTAGWLAYNRWKMSSKFKQE